MSNSIVQSITDLKNGLPPHVTLVAVSKTKPISDIQAAYDGGQRHFGENKVLELVEKSQSLPKDITWHFIGHLQTNKVKKVVEAAHLIHSIDSVRLLAEVDKRAANAGKIQDILLQVHIAQESQKFGFDESEVLNIAKKATYDYKNIRICGLMGMATFTQDEATVKSEFEALQRIFTAVKGADIDQMESFKELSMGMSGDFTLAIECGSTMVRIGSTIFGSRG